MTRILPLLLLAGCAAVGPAGDGTVRIVREPGGAAAVEISRAGTWKTVARIRSERPLAGGADGGGARLDGAGPLEVEVPGPRTLALFPGIEFLEGAEASSEQRRRPEPWKITVPLMAFETDGVLVELAWSGPAQPQFTARDRSTMSLSDCGDGLRCSVLVRPGATIYDAVPLWASIFGLPGPEPWPRTLEEELALCKAGFASVGAPRGKHRHAAGKDWPAEWTPGFGVLLHLLGEKVDWFDYSDLLSTVNCHILKWEAPFYAGEPETARKLVERMKILANLRNEEDLEWGFHPMSAEQRKLGKAGDSVLGTNAHNALSVAKAARMTGDPDLKAIALDALGRMRRHKVPRGGQNWECPLYEPDLLSAAFAVGAYVEAAKLTGDAAWRAEAVRWAKAGLSFVYLWNLPGRREMRYASIPVLGTTQSTQEWFGVPVQWNGLVFAYYLRKLAPLDPGFDWLKVADGITASAVHQQYTDGPSKGCTPSGLHDRLSRRTPPDLNPEDLLVNILTSIGRDPDPDLTVGVSASQKR